MSRIEYTTVSRRDPLGDTWWLRSTPSSFAPEPLNGRAAGEVEEMRTEFDCDTTQLVECVAEHQQLGLAVDPTAPRRRHIPGVADLQTTVGRVDLHVAGRPDEGAVEAVHHECQTHVRLLHCQAPVDPLLDLVRPRCCGEPEAAQFAVGRGGLDLRNMLATKRFQRDPSIPGQGDRLHEPAHDTRLAADHAVSIAHTDSSTANTAAAAPMYSPYPADTGGYT